MRMKRDDPDPDVGVGPHPRPWPEDPHFDPELLAQGDRRNVADHFRYWRHQAIVAELAITANPFHVAIENWRHDNNIGTVVRNANAFGAAAVHVVGRRSWNRRGAMVTDRYLQIHHHDDIAALQAWAGPRELPLVGIDNLPGSVSLFTNPPPEAVVMVLGQEGPGLSSAAREAVDIVLHVPQFGSTRSINAGVASGIAMAGWVQTHRPDNHHA
ncbi:MAG: TrmH family RNA methyltransferase [Euzebya sp.]